MYPEGAARGRGPGEGKVLPWAAWRVPSPRASRHFAGCKEIAPKNLNLVPAGIRLAHRAF